MVSAIKGELAQEEESGPVSGPTHDHAGLGTRVFASTNNGHAVHKNVSDPVRDLMGIFVRGPVDDGLRIEDDDIGIKALAEHTPIQNRETRCDGRSHLPDGVFERHDTLLANVSAEDPCEGAV